MRLLQMLFAALFIAAGVVVGALNPQPMTLDFYAWHIHAGVGVAMLSAVLGGALLGGAAVLAGVVWPLQRRLRRARPDSPVHPDSAPAASPSRSNPDG